MRVESVALSEPSNVDGGCCCWGWVVAEEEEDVMSSMERFMVSLTFEGECRVMREVGWFGDKCGRFCSVWWARAKEDEVLLLFLKIDNGCWLEEVLVNV